MSNLEKSNVPVGNEENSHRPLQNLDSATKPNSNHHLECPSCLKVAEAEAVMYKNRLEALKTCSGRRDCPPRPTYIPNQYRDPNCPDCGPRLPPFPRVCGDPTCCQCSPLPASVCRCPSYLEAMPPFVISLGGQQQSTADCTLVNKADFMMEEDRGKERQKIFEERPTRQESAEPITLENTKARFGLYPPSNTRHKRSQRTSTAKPMPVSITSDTERNFATMEIKKEETRFGSVGRSMCAYGHPTCPGEMQEAPTHQSITNTSPFEEIVAARPLPQSMFRPSFYTSPIGEVLRPAAMWPGLMLTPSAVPRVPTSSPGFTGPNNIWPGRAFAPPTPMAMYNLGSNTLGLNNIWLDGMFAPRLGAIPKQGQPGTGMQCDDEIKKRQAHYSKVLYQRYFGRMESWKRRAREERASANMKADMSCMVKGDLKMEQDMVKLGQKAFDSLDTWERLVLSKQKLEKAKTELVACEIACEVAENERSLYERRSEDQEKVDMKESRERRKKLATNDLSQQSEGDGLINPPRDPLGKVSSAPAEIKKHQICDDCGGIKEDIQDDKSTSREFYSVV